MPLKLYDTKDAVPDTQRASAIETKEGKWAVDEPVDVAAVRAEGQRAIEAERERAKEEEKKRKAAEKERDDLKRAQEARAKGITEEQLAEIQKKEAEARKPLEDKLAAAEKENRKLKLTDRVKAKALEAGIMPDRIDKAMRDLDGRFDLTEDGNSIVLLDAAGKPTGKPWDEFLAKDYKAEAPFFYAGSGGSGSGAQGSDSGAASGYDPLAAGKKAGERQKQTTADAALALK